MNFLIGLVLVGFSQDPPIDIPKGELPKLAPCVVCSAKGEMHGDEKPAAGLKYKGKSYYFCNAAEIKTFKADPEGFMPPVLPRAMPAIDLKDRSGDVWNQASFRGKLVLVDFMASWCKPCHEIKPRLDKLRAELNPKGFKVLSISIDEKADALEKYLAKAKFANPVAHDTKETWSAWRVKAIPAMFLVKDGQIVHQWTGKPKKGDLESKVRANLIVQ